MLLGFSFLFFFLVFQALAKYSASQDMRSAQIIALVGGGFRRRGAELKSVAVSEYIVT